jgi:hypothetical protein
MSAPFASAFRGRPAWMLLAPLLALLLPLQQSAHATLGGAPSTAQASGAVQAPQAQLKAAPEAAAEVHAGYTVHQTTTPGGTVVREYTADSTGQVFAVRWKGPFMPDLQQLLGEHYQSFADGARQGRGRSSLLVQQPGLVIYSGGRMRAFAGMAYLSQQLPEGVHAEDLR